MRMLATNTNDLMEVLAYKFVYDLEDLKSLEFDFFRVELQISFA